MNSRMVWITLACLLLLSLPYHATGAEDTPFPDSHWVTTSASSAGSDTRARDEAVDRALRKAVEETCGVFLESQSQMRHYRGIYDSVLADTKGYVEEYKVLKTWLEDGSYHATVRAKVSRERFEDNWRAIAHTYARETHPRVIVAIAETTYEMVNEVAVEADASSRRLLQAAARQRSDAEASHAAAAARSAAAYAETGDANPRDPDNYAASTAAEAAAAESHASASREDSAALSAEEARRLAASLHVWKRIANELQDRGIVQARMEEFFLDKGIRLADRSQTAQVNKRDMMLASAREDLSALAALGARHNADVILLGSAAAKPADTTVLTVAGTEVKQYHYTTRLVVRAIRTDTGQLIVSKVFNGEATSTRRSGGEEKALRKLADEAAPKILAAVSEAWRRQVHNARDVTLVIHGLGFRDYTKIKQSLASHRAVRAVDLRGIVEHVAEVHLQYEGPTERLAEILVSLDAPRLDVTEITPNRVVLKTTSSGMAKEPAPSTEASEEESEPTPDSNGTLQ